jgi:hypothetical protein
MVKKLVLFVILISVILIGSCEVDLIDQETVEPVTGLVVKGGTAEVLTGLDAGLPPEAYPQITCLTMEEYQGMKERNEIPDTGLFLVDTDYVPENIEALLEDASLTLCSDGTLINAEGQLATLVMNMNTYKMTPDDAQTKASPYPWERWRTSYNDYFYYDGVKKYFKAYIKAWSESKVNGNWISTRIEYMETEVDLGNAGSDSDHCYNCDYETSSKRTFIGYLIPPFVFPPAVIVTGTQYFYMKDGSMSAAKTYYF